MKRIRFVVVASALALSACAYGQGGTGVFLADCSKETAKHTEGVDWETASTAFLRIRQGNFNPSYVGLLQGKAYVLRVENGDDDEHFFRAIDFFRSVAVEKISVVGGRTFDRPCLDALALPPRSTTEVRLVAVRDGSYEFQNNSLLMSMALVGSSGGFITIEKPRNLPAFPLASLQLRETVPITPIEDKPSPGLFDDEEETPTPGLFDDQVEETPGLFDDPAEPAPMPDQPPAASLQPAPKAIPEGMFGEPSPDAIDLPEPKAVPEPDADSGMPPEQPIEASPSIPVIRDTGPELDNSVNEMPAPETTVMAEPEPADTKVPVETTPEAVSSPEAPEGPTADIYSDPPDPSNKPGPGGDGGNDTFGAVG